MDEETMRIADDDAPTICRTCRDCDICRMARWPFQDREGCPVFREKEEP